MLRDPEIRRALRKWIRSNRDPHLICDEIPVKDASSLIDLVAITDKIHAYEIKGRTDKMTRVENQVKHSSAIAHLASVVATENHVDAILEATPEWWEVIRVSHDDSMGIQMEVVREGSLNPSGSFQIAAMTLWKREMLDILRAQGLKAEESWSKWLLMKKLETLYKRDLEKLRAEIIWRWKLRAEDPEWHEIHVKGLEIGSSRSERRGRAPRLAAIE